jgi:hypothetical protein
MSDVPVRRFDSITGMPVARLDDEPYSINGVVRFHGTKTTHFAALSMLSRETCRRWLIGIK